MHTTLLRIIKKSLYRAFENARSGKEAIEYSSKEQNYSLGRRQALRHIGLGTAGLTMSGLPFIGANGYLTRLASDRRQPSIAILGGGIAGLHCAWLLQRQGIHATVFEASQRAGGRMYSLHERFGKGLHIEAGGEFLDTSHSDMLGLAQHFGLKVLDVTTDPDHYEEAIFHFGGHKYSQDDVVNAFGPAVNTLIAHREQCGEDYDTEFAQTLDRQSLEEYLRKLPCEKWLQDMLLYAYVGEYGLDGGDQSSLNFLCLIGFPKDGKMPLFGDSDERFKVIGGNQQIIYKLAEQLGDKINFGRSVRAIIKKGRQYQIEFDAGEVFKADFVVCTIPFTVLRHIDLQLGSVHPDKMACIREIGYGMNNKLLMAMNQRVWRQGARPSFGYTYDEMIHTGWDNGHMQNNNTGKSGFTVFLGGSPSLALATQASLVGNQRKLSDNHLATYVDRLESIYAGFSQHFLNDHEVITWSGNPYSKGSYACYKTGQWSGISGWEAEPIGDNFLFAGEHCSVAFQGFMNGAAETGRMAASKIAQMVAGKVRK